MPTVDSPQSLLGVTAHFLYGLRIGVIAVVATVLASLSLTRNPAAYRPFWVQVAVFILFMIILAAEAYLAYRRRGWGRIRWIGIAAALAATVASCLSLPPGGAATSADWAYGLVGWVGVIFLLERPLKELAAFLFAIAGINLYSLTLTPDLGIGAYLNFMSASIGTIGYPLGVGVGAAVLRGVAGQAYDASQRSAQIRAEESLADALHEFRQRRFDDLSRSALPLLRGLADGCLDPDDTDVQRASAIEAARMRRLFAESDDVPDQLLHELRMCVEIAERKGITVELQTQGSCPDPPLEIRRTLTEAPMTALATAKTTARVTVTASPDGIAVNTVSDSGDVDIPTPRTGPVRVTVLHDEPTLWVEAQWNRN